MQQLLIEVSHQDQVFVEEECAKHGYSISGFFEMLLNEYKKPSEPKKKEEVKLPSEEKEIPTEEVNEEEKEADENPKRTRKKKSE